MRSTMALVLVLFGCAPAVPTNPRIAQADDERADTASTSKSIAARQASERDAALERARIDAALQASARDVAMHKSIADAPMKAAEARTAMCAKTRAGRAQAAQQDVTAYVEWLKRIAPVMRQVKAQCKIAMVRTGALKLDTAASGWRIYPEQRETIACSGGLPKGVTEDDVAVLLYRLASPPDESAPISDRGSADICGDADREVGLDTAVTANDAEGVKRLLAWKP